MLPDWRAPKYRRRLELSPASAARGGRYGNRCCAPAVLRSLPLLKLLKPLKLLRLLKLQRPLPLLEQLGQLCCCC